MKRCAERIHVYKYYNAPHILGNAVHYMLVSNVLGEFGRTLVSINTFAVSNTIKSTVKEAYEELQG